MTEEWIRQLCVRIELPLPEQEAVFQVYKTHGKKIRRLAARMYRIGDLPYLHRMIEKDPALGGALSLAVVLAAAEKTKAAYHELGIPDEVFRQTMGDITIWCHNFNMRTGAVGLGESNWLVNHLRLRLFRLGRLQFERARLSIPKHANPAAGPLPPLHEGARCLNVHIPQGEPLDPAACSASFHQAQQFMQKYFPKEAFQWFTCCSWLLWPDNRVFLSPESNILHFFDFWNVIGAIPDPQQAIERIWGCTCADPASYAEDTTLRRRAKAFLQAGGALGEGYGVRSKNT